MKNTALAYLLTALPSFCLQAQCPDAFFCSDEKDVAVFQDSLPLCEDIFDGQKDGFTDYVEFLGCGEGNNWVTRFFRRSSFDRCKFDNQVHGYFNDAAPYKTIFFDDFILDTLQTKYWRTLYELPPPFDTIHTCQGEPNAMLPENAIIKDGKVVLSIHKLDTPMSFKCTNRSGEQKTTLRNYSSGTIQTYFGPVGVGAEGVFRYGRYTVRCKIPSKKGATAAFWLFGWAGEIDVFEICAPDCDEIQFSRHNYLFNTQANVCDSIPDKYSGYPMDHYIGDFRRFREYTFEWTPHYFALFVDGVHYQTFHRYWRISSNNNQVCAAPLNCEDLPNNGEFDVWEHIAWWTMTHKLNLLLTNGVSEGYGKPDYDEFIIDWVKVEQKTSNYISGDSTLCDSSPKTFTLVSDALSSEDIKSWSVSDNLEILETLAFSAKVRKKDNVKSNEGWIEVNYKDNNISFGQTLQKKLTIGLPAIPEINVIESCNSQTISIHNPSYSTNYKWKITDGFMLLNNSGVGTSFDAVFSKNFIDQTVPFEIEMENQCGVSYYSGEIRTVSCEKEKSITITPNPADTKARVLLKNFSLEDYKQGLQITITNSIGSIANHYTIHSTSFEIDLTNFSRGIYIVLAKVKKNVLAQSKLLVYK
jgi:beta-glucanase (GH16 family)